MPDITVSYGRSFDFHAFFLGIFIHYWRVFMSNKVQYLHQNKTLQIVCLIDVHILECQHAKCDYWLWKVLWFNCFFFGYFSYNYYLHVWKDIISSNFYKLYVKAEVYKWKVILCKHSFWLICYFHPYSI